MMFPNWHTQAIYDGLISTKQRTGLDDVIMLPRSAWAGMSKYGAALWSGDTDSTWTSLQVSVTAGLNAQMSGIAWWTTDIGGYAKGDIESADFRELIVRWFQYGSVCSLFRQHGARDTEIWLLGDEAEAAITKTIKWRADMKGYVLEAMKSVSETGQPVNRPLIFDFPEDQNCWGVERQFMFGANILAAPVTVFGARTWSVYLPTQGGSTMTTWKHMFTNEMFIGGQTYEIDAPLDEFPLFQMQD